MRVVLVTHFYPAHGGGIEQVAAQLAKGLAAAGHQLVWCASDGDALPCIPGVEARPMRSFDATERLSGTPYPLWSPAALRLLAQEVRDADAVHVHDAIYAGSLAAAWLARRHRKRLVVTQHIATVPLPAVLRPMLALANRVAAATVLAPADAVAYISPQVQAYFERLVPNKPSSAYVPNGVDTQVFTPSIEPRAILRARLGFDAERPLLLFVGRFVPKKRLPLIRAVAQIHPRWQWCLVGRGPENPASWALPNVRLTGALGAERLADLYRAADLLVLPSVGEGFPLVVQEAMACGLPACIRPEVAAGAALPAPLWMGLPPDGLEPPAETRAASKALDDALNMPARTMTALREAVTAHANKHWRWEASTAWHEQQLLGEKAG